MKRYLALSAVILSITMLSGCSAARSTTPEIVKNSAWITTELGDVECIVNDLEPSDGNRSGTKSDDGQIKLEGNTDCNWNTLAEKGSHTPDSYSDFQGTWLKESDGTKTFCIVNFTRLKPPTTDCNWK